MINISIRDVNHCRSSHQSGGGEDDCPTTASGPGLHIRTVELYPLVATRVRHLIREGVPRGWTGLRADDAVHLATAKDLDVSEFHTYDERLSR